MLSVIGSLQLHTILVVYSHESIGSVKELLVTSLTILC